MTEDKIDMIIKKETLSKNILCMKNIISKYKLIRTILLKISLAKCYREKDILLFYMKKKFNNKIILSRRIELS